MSKIRIFKDGTIDSMTEEEFKALPLDEQKKLAMKLFEDLDETDRNKALKIIRMQSLLITSNIFDDYCGMVQMYHDNIVDFINRYLPDTEFVRQLDAIDTFADKDSYTVKLIELDVNMASYMAEHVSESDVKSGYDPIRMSMLQFAYSHWIGERNGYMEFIESAFENEVDRKAIEDIVKNNTDGSNICEKIAGYLDSKFETIQFSEQMGTPEFF